MYDGIADLKKCYLRSKSVEDDEKNCETPSVKTRLKNRIPVSKTAFATYDDALKISNGDQNENKLKIEIFEDTDPYSTIDSQFPTLNATKS